MSIKNKTKDRDDAGRIKRSVTNPCNWNERVPKYYRNAFYHRRQRAIENKNKILIMQGRYKGDEDWNFSRGTCIWEWF